MASIFRKPGNKTWWATYYHAGKRIRRSLGTTQERLALRKLRKIEGDLVTGELERKTHTPIEPFLEELCEYLATTRTPKSCKNDISYLRTFFGPVCDALQPRSTVNHRFQPRKEIVVPDMLARHHVKVKTLEQVTPQMIGSHRAPVAIALDPSLSLSASMGLPVLPIWPCQHYIDKSMVVNDWMSPSSTVPSVFVSPLRMLHDG